VADAAVLDAVARALADFDLATLAAPTCTFLETAGGVHSPSAAGRHRSRRPAHVAPPATPGQCADVYACLCARVRVCMSVCACVALSLSLSVSAFA
jgi:hypothetical protein